MKHFLQFCGCLLLMFIFFNLLFLFALPRLDWEFGKTKEANDFKNQQFKILVFGNSTAFDAINTELLSKRFGKSYNFSLGGASLETNFIQLKAYLEKNAKPEHVLLFLSSTHINYINPNDVNPIVGYYYESGFKMSSLKDIPLFKFRWLFIENIKKLMSANHRNATIVNGQLRIKSIVPDDSDTSLRAIICPDNLFYASSGYDYLWQIATLCKNEKIKLTVFEMPCWKSQQNDCPDIAVSRTTDNTKNSLNIRNLNNFRICETLIDPNNHWLSKNHLNYFGSIIFTNEVERILSQKIK